ncbi:MAG TPA: AbrB/MazE/SpoVT family DNA-binding domain-containing protein [Terriglobales bacterium]|nr:AbrB/MazE/SpoVT family DNA-binding domain-containing protein [Terriglobales bacterium]
MKTQMAKWGNNLAVRIPKPVAIEARLKEGDSLEVRATAEGVLEVRKTSRIPTLAQLVSQITPENRYAETSASSEVDDELVEW